MQHARPYWHEPPVFSDGPQRYQPSAVGHLRNNVAFAIVALYLIFNWGFQQIRIPPVGGAGLPMAELTLVFFFLTTHPMRVLGQLGRVVHLLPFVAWWLFGLGRAAFDVTTGGFWALRDAAHVIESLFLLVGFVFAASPAALERFFKWLPVIVGIAACYGVLYPVRELFWTFSPTIVTPNGIEAPILGVMANSAFMMIMAGFYLLLFHPRNVGAVTLAALLIAYPVAVFQARTLYLTVIALFGFFIMFRPSARGHVARAVFHYVMRCKVFAARKAWPLRHVGLKRSILPTHASLVNTSRPPTSPVARKPSSDSIYFLQKKLRCFPLLWLTAK